MSESELKKKKKKKGICSINIKKKNFSHYIQSGPINKADKANIMKTTPPIRVTVRVDIF